MVCYKHTLSGSYESFLIEETQLKPALGEGDSARVARVELENLGKK